MTDPVTSYDEKARELVDLSPFIANRGDLESAIAHALRDAAEAERETCLSALQDVRTQHGIMASSSIRSRPGDESAVRAIDDCLQAIRSRGDGAPDATVGS